MLVGFDPAKCQKNEQERGFGFLVAAGIFDGDTVEVVDRRRDYGEERIIALGRTGSLTLVVVYTWRQDLAGEAVRWMISARPAKRKEREIHAAFFP
ncbi:BrnT family toxin [Aerophototrophica crusticola]|uniref:BrnT family toxin n=1 Tax=Aerophototrophica crusticola TaxID=1709002 RepID=A0A858R4K9_9PROT|nr:BrnT family toxin [Rhodospirillaceae bacterium B3]